MANTIPADTHAQGDTTHLTDHNNMADVLGLLAQVLASQLGGVYDNTNATAIAQLVAMDQAPLSAFKAADTPRASTTALSNDPDLFIPLQANAVYEIRGMISYAGGAGASEGDIKMAWSYTGTTSWFVLGAPHYSNSGVFPPGPPAAPVSCYAIGAGQIVSETNGTSGSNDFAMTLLGTIKTSTAGTLHFQWAQNTSNGTNSYLRQGSYIAVQRMG